ncbi:MAG: hypothetical protein JOZ07_16315 [Solirubrobacterales bacterium]|nr:hypothetical protein [Solirubrobacterales bacterium]
MSRAAESAGAAESARARAEVLKLARLLQREPASLSYLERLGLDDLRALRLRVTETLFDAQSGSLRGLAGVSRLVPVGLGAAIGQSVFGPLLSAQITTQLDPERAVEMAARLPTAFLADVAIEIDPRRAAAVIARIPAPRVAEVTAELVRRGEHVTMGRYVAYLSDDAIAAALAAMDPSSTLEVAFVLEEPERLPTVMRLLPLRRWDGLVAAAIERGLWVQALWLAGALRQRERAALIAAIERSGPAGLRSLAAAVAAHDLGDEAALLAAGSPAVRAALRR